MIILREDMVLVVFRFEKTSQFIIDKDWDIQLNFLELKLYVKETGDSFKRGFSLVPFQSCLW